MVVKKHYNSIGDKKEFMDNIKKGDKFHYIQPYFNRRMTLTYTGTRREVKGVLMDFFTTEKGETVFFYPSEVERDFVKI